MWFSISLVPGDGFRFSGMAVSNIPELRFPFYRTGGTLAPEYSADVLAARRKWSTWLKAIYAITTKGVCSAGSVSWHRWRSTNSISRHKKDWQPKLSVEKTFLFFHCPLDGEQFKHSSRCFFVFADSQDRQYYNCEAYFSCSLGGIFKASIACCVDKCKVSIRLRMEVSVAWMAPSSLPLLRMSFAS